MAVLRQFFKFLNAKRGKTIWVKRSRNKLKSKPEIKARNAHLRDHWTQLKAKCDQRRQDLEDSLQAHQYFSDATEAEAFMKEKESLAGNADYGKDEDSAEALSKRHEAFMSDLEMFKSTIEGLKEQATNCK